MPDILLPYAWSLIALLIVMIGLWLISVRINDPSFIDAVWPTGFIFLAAATALQLGELSDRALLIFALTAIWGARLGLHLFTRWRNEGEDRRYKAIKARAKGNVHVFTLVYVFMMQGVLLFITALPIQYGMAAPALPLGVLAYAGIALWALGFLFETIGDWQLARFKADPANEGKVMDRGLWRYTRHPNYFGDACVFWGLFLIMIESNPAPGGGWWTIIGPLFLTFTLTSWSGKKLLEKNLHESRPDYADYVRRTPGFIPWFPKKAGSGES